CLGMGPAPAYRCLGLAAAKQTDLAEPAGRGGRVFQHHVSGTRVSHADATLILSIILWRPTLDYYSERFLGLSAPRVPWAQCAGLLQLGPCPHHRAAVQTACAVFSLGSTVRSAKGGRPSAEAVRSDSGESRGLRGRAHRTASRAGHREPRRGGAGAQDVSQAR